MPTYEYQCKKCENIFEEFQPITSPPLETCPRCGGQVFRLISSGAGIIFKGSGFYQTDYRSSDYNKKASEEKSSGSSSTSSTVSTAATKTDSKPAS